ncbi:MAG: VWA domain-containing protein [Deltaproteobacteria bacterium]|nr:VWA domain-containing protein [Deltaproteobacteria bacterium]
MFSNTKMVLRGLVIFVVFASLTGACGPSSSSGKGNDGSITDDSTTTDGGLHQDGSTDDSGKHEAGIEGCDPKDFVLQQAPPPQVFLVVDRSGSMLEAGSDPQKTKWEELITAIESVLTQFEGQIQFGLLMYPTGNECGTSGPQVQVALHNKLGVLHFLNQATPAGGTPTAAAVTNAAHALQALDAGSDKFIILATDGGPNCNYGLSADPQCSCSLTDQNYCCTNYPDGQCVFGQYCLDDDHTASVLGDLHSNSTIDTFVIGLAGTAEYAETLNAMADSGGRAQSGPVHYYDASDQTALTNALTDIAGSVISCRIDLDEAPDEPDYVLIYMDGTQVPRDPNNGWDYTDDSHMAIELYGDACDTLKSGNDHVITATFACEVQ